MGNYFEGYPVLVCANCNGEMEYNQYKYYWEYRCPRCKIEVYFKGDDW